MSEKYECMHLQWDTDYFGIHSARINLQEPVDEKTQNKIISFCKGYEFITISNNGNLQKNNEWIGKRTNAFLADVNIQFSKELDTSSSYQDEATYVLNTYPHNERVVNIASNSFQYSRFYNDPLLPQELAKNIYVHWTQSSFSQENKYFVLCERESEIAGYMIFSIRENIASVELIAVHKDFQRKKVGESLINKIEEYVLNKGIRLIKVGTQVNNISAIQFYTKMGFKYVNCGSIYHYWSEINNQ